MMQTTPAEATSQMNEIRTYIKNAVSTYLSTNNNYITNFDFNTILVEALDTARQSKTLNFIIASENRILTNRTDIVNAMPFLLRALGGVSDHSSFMTHNHPGALASIFFGERKEALYGAFRGTFDSKDQNGKLAMLMMMKHNTHAAEFNASVQKVIHELAKRPDGIILTQKLVNYITCVTLGMDPPRDMNSFLFKQIFKAIQKRGWYDSMFSRIVVNFRAWVSDGPSELVNDEFLSTWGKIKQQGILGFIGTCFVGLLVVLPLQLAVWIGKFIALSVTFIILFAVGFLSFLIEFPSGAFNQNRADLKWTTQVTNAWRVSARVIAGCSFGIDNGLKDLDNGLKDLDPAAAATQPSGLSQPQYMQSPPPPQGQYGQPPQPQYGQPQQQTLATATLIYPSSPDLHAWQGVRAKDIDISGTPGLSELITFIKDKTKSACSLYPRIEASLQGSSNCVSQCQLDLLRSILINTESMEESDKIKYIDDRAGHLEERFPIQA